MPPTVRARSSRPFLLALAALLPLLTGCLRYTQALTIHADDTVSGVIVLAAQQPDAGAAAPATPSGAALPRPQSASENIVVARFLNGPESGYKVTLTRASFAEVAAFAPLGEDGGALLVTRYGRELQIMMTLDLTYPLSGAGQQYIAAHADATVSLKVPGEVSATNGDAGDGVITWTLQPFVVNTVWATVSSPVATAAAPTGTRSVDPLRAALLAAGVLVAAGLLRWSLRRLPAARPPARRPPTRRLPARRPPTRRGPRHAAGSRARRR